MQRAAEGLIAPGGTFVTAVGPTQYMGVDGVMPFGQWCGALCTILKYAMCSCGRKYQYVMIGAEPPLKQETFDLVAGVGARTTIALETPFALEPFREALRRARQQQEAMSAELSSALERCEALQAQVDARPRLADLVESTVPRLSAEDEHAPSPRQRLGVDRRQQAGDTRASELLEDRVERSRRGA